MATQQKSTEKQFPTHIDIAAEKRTALIEMLNQHLADTFDPRQPGQAGPLERQGEDFYQLHLLFDVIAGEVFEFVDLIAERVTTLGGYATGTVRMSAEHSALTEYPTTAIAGLDHVKALVDRFGVYAGRIRQAIDDSDEIGDPTTADLYTEVSRKVDERLWFLEAHLQSNG